MTIVQKAKAYDKAIEKINSKWHYKNQPCFVDAAEIFPELAESEDEKIRKALIEHVKKHLTAIEGIDRADAIAWIEKQGEQKSKWGDEGIREAQLDYWRSVGGKEWHGVPVQETIAWLEKQAPKLVEEDEIGSDATIELLEYFINYAPEFRKPTIRRSIDWLKSLKQRMEEQ